MADHVQEEVGGNTVQPAFKRTGLILIQGAEDAHEGFLGEVLCIVLITRETIRQAVDAIGMLGHQVTPGGHVGFAGIERRGTGQLRLRGGGLKGFGIALRCCHVCHLSTLQGETPPTVLIISCESVTLSPPTTTSLARRVFATSAATFPYGLLRDYYRI